MKSNRVLAGTAVLLSSFDALGVPFVAMLVLQPQDYGEFSLLYLAAAVGSTLQLSLVNEAWVRAGTASSRDESWSAYANATILVALCGAAIAAGTSLVFPNLRHVAVWAFLAVFAQGYRNGARFRAFRNFDWKHVFLADGLGTIATICTTIYLILTPQATLASVVVCWSLSRVVGTIGSRMPGPVSPKKGIRWFAQHAREIRVLISDSALSDVAAIGTPYTLVPILGAADLGVYRALGSLSGPFRSLILPLRPALSRVPKKSLGSVRFILISSVAAVLVGISTSLMLLAMRSTNLELGTVNSLYGYSPAVGIFICGSVVGYLYSMIARQVASARGVLSTRTLEAVGGTIIPIATASIWGLTGAIWGYALYKLAAGILWLLRVRIDTRSDR